MSTIRDVAKESGLSTGTISKALSDPKSVSPKSLSKVQAAITKLNYKPNMLSQKFRNKQSKTIVILVPDIANLFFAQVISGIEHVVHKHGFSVLLGDTNGEKQREQEYIKMVETRLADGLVNLCPHMDQGSILPLENVVAVSAGGCENTPYPSVRIDNVGASEKVVDYLISLGHRRIGVISGLEDNPHSIDRLKGYRNSIEKAGIKFEPELIYGGDFNFWSGLSASEYFYRLKDKMPTALFCMNDDMAISAMKGMLNNGLKIPEDISITGFDDLQVSRYVNPALTTISQPAQKIGEKSAELLLQLLEGKNPNQTEYVLPYDFIIRESTSAIK
ncbi:LacI family transcriptional regulator [Psychrosphaera sp. B3R10]|uniref:LacI family DNA-binding transcriptional regulator n=1 Tax=unclassified Psychrosphaera TaxID=2641570 RepID=UPI001C08E522|nr:MULTISPECIES: LacI family DNA-binding transcriptional regulator [unclassified Psychrosphaera]MBU2880542.1 LacI family transcriptional regulator [Psychrosphaera sp. I2R16]MBU2989137.1 LacI family transcriptional regulator [Psychrosphaera sp. B3R10]MDO6717794.1 LacI family DNA-binding transcriptional regulator [Psychrosphaera sp. 1_MG-2023]